MSKTLFHRFVLSLSRTHKRMVLVAFDTLALTLALWSGYALRLADLWPTSYLKAAIPLFIATPIIGVIIFTRLGLYRAVIRFFSGQAVLAVLKGVTVLALTLYSISALLEINSFPRSVPINFALASLVYVGGSRLAVRHYYHWLIGHSAGKEPIIIYGAGSAGVALATALLRGKEFEPKAFVDDDKALWGRTMQGIAINNPDTLATTIEKNKASQLLIALPTATISERQLVLNKVAKLPVKVKVMPSMPEIVDGELPKLRDVQIEDLLGRDPVPPLPGLIEQSLENKNVLVTGAGGSIGSEIARQAILGGAKTLVLYEQSEFSLYTIERELNTASTQCKVISILGSVVDQARLYKALHTYQINTVYHAAAYKHVPLVEHNIAEGVRNNTLGTLHAAKSAIDAQVERFVLISTDKAVRPTNVMGATKRAAEIVLQNLNRQKHDTILSMVRFGNVLGSSGSVVPLFTKQIKSGGPITVTHKDINRYFMTIPEAASLVIQAGSMAKGGEVFVLDMGEVVKITDLAEKMITLMGYSVQNTDNPEGDIAIHFTGLRPGEKLYEELLIGDNVSGTEHAKIMMAEEHFPTEQQLDEALPQMKQAIEQNNSKGLRNELNKLVQEFQPANLDVDWLKSDRARKDRNNVTKLNN